MITGNYAIVDQGQNLIGGYTDDNSKVLKCKLPVIVFGDHSKNVKLINFPFAPGADGTAGDTGPTRSRCSLVAEEPTECRCSVFF